MDKERLQIAFLSSSDAGNKNGWSGTPYYMAKALEKHCGEVHYLGPVRPGLALLRGKMLSFLSQKLLGKRYDYFHSVNLAKAYSKLFSSKLNLRKYDVIVAPAASTCLAFLDTSIPIVYVSDSTFAKMINYYAAYTNLVRTSEKQGMEVEKRAIAKSSLALFPSKWASDSAIKDYGTEPSKVHTIPLGANIDELPSREEILTKKKGTKCRLLFLGVNWERKGGEIAFETLAQLIAKGIDAELTVCGCVPPVRFGHPKMKVIPFLNKNQKNDYKIFQDLLLNSDFLILPSRNECFGIVFCEASAFGLPSIATDTGGISGAIKEGENGFLLPLSATGTDFANLIADIFNSDEKYYSLVKKSRNFYESALNWEVWAREVNKLIIPLLA